VLAFFANVYASWNQPQMVWKGGFILCSIILVVVLASPWEDEPFEILKFWLGRAVPIYMSALVGGVLGIFFASNRT